MGFDWFYKVRVDVINFILVVKRRNLVKCIRVWINLVMGGGMKIVKKRINCMGMFGELILFFEELVVVFLELDLGVNF